MILSTSSLTLTEGENATFTVKLSEQPTGSGFGSKNVRVQLPHLLANFNEEDGTAYFPSKENPVLAVRPLRRTFTPTNWNTAQTFRVFAIQSNASADVTELLRLSSSQSFQAGEDRNYKDTTHGLPVTVKKASTSATRPVVSITPAKEYAAETAGKGGKFTVSRTGPTTSHLVVYLFVSEKTDGGQIFMDHADKGLRMLLIPSGRSSATYTARIKSDQVDEPNGEVSVLVRSSGNYTIDGTAGKASVPILDDDGPQIVSIEAGASPVTEGQDATFTIRRTGGPITGSLTVGLGVEEKDSSAGDFVASTDEGRDKTVTIPAGQLSVTYTVPTVNDNVDEDDGPVSVWIRRNDSVYLRHEDDISRIETTVTVQDNDGDGDNSAPVVANPIPNQTATVGSSFSYAFPTNTFSDPDGDTLTYTATVDDGSALPTWLSFDATTRTVSGTPGNGDAGTLTLRVTADDGNGNTVFDDFAIIISTPGNNAPVVANPIPDRTATVGTNFSYQFPANTFSDPDGDTLTYTATGQDRAGLTFTASSRTFSGTPQATHVGTHNVTVTASDPDGLTVSDTFTITVSAGNSAPVVDNPIPNRTGTDGATVGSSFSYAFPANTFSDPDGDTLTYTATRSGGGTLPTWLTFTANTRTFSGTPGNGDTGTLTLRVTATDPDGLTVSDTFEIAVTDPTPVVSFATSSATAEEDAGSIEVTLNLNPAPTANITIDYSVTGSADQDDYTVPGSVDVSAGASTVTIPIDITDDDEYESSETVVLTLSEGTGYTRGSRRTYTLTIRDNEPHLRITPTELRVKEGGSASYNVRLTHPGNITVTITKGGDTDGDLEISLADADAEESGQEETPETPPPLELAFDFDNWDTPQTVMVRAMEDEDNTNEQITITHQSAEVPAITGVVSVTISDNDITPSEVVKAGLVRFGRTVGEQSVAAIKDRLTQPPPIGFRGNLVGHALSKSDCDATPLHCSDTSETVSLPSPDRFLPGHRLRVHPEEPLASIRGLESPGDASRVLTLEEMVAGTSFAMTRERVDGQVVSLWGQGSRSGFAGRQGLIGFAGDVTGFLLGWDRRHGDRVHGVMLSQTGGDIAYHTDAGLGAMELELTAVVPYAARTLRKDMRVWGALGFGAGKLTHREVGEAPVRADMDWRMAALGVSGDLPSSAILSGAALSWYADGLWTHTGVDAASDGESWAAFAGATLRSRVGVVAAWEQVLGNGSVVRPSLDVGLRHDAGDAETGLGVEIGGSVAWSNPSMPGLSLIVRGRKLVLHAEDAFDDWGMSIAFVYDPSPTTREGVSAQLSQALGGLSPDTRPVLSGDALPTTEGRAMARNWTAEIAHGTDIGQGRVGSPYLAVQEGTTEQTTRLGYRMEPDLDQEQEYRIDVWAEPKESGNDGTRSGRAGLSLSTRW